MKRDGPTTGDDVEDRLLDDSEDSDAEYREKETCNFDDPSYDKISRSTARLPIFLRTHLLAIGCGFGAIIILAILGVVFRSSLDTLSFFSGDPPSHPIDWLIKDSYDEFQQRLSGHPSVPDLEYAAAAYRRHRGRHPPPGFKQWWAWAKKSNCIIHEWMFDQVYQDIAPFWGVPPDKIRADAESWPVIISIRSGTIKRRSKLLPFWADRDWTWEQMLKQIPVILPDMDISLNLDDTAHIFVPWEDMKVYMEKAELARGLRQPHEMSENTAMLPPPGKDATFTMFEDGPSEHDIWLLTRDTCHPDSVARSTAQDTTFSTPAVFPAPGSYMNSGYISNWTKAKSVCENPALRNLQGYFLNFFEGSRMQWNITNGTVRIGASDRLLTRKLFPVFSPCKLQGSNNDILIPPASSWSDAYFTEDPVKWARKEDGAIWRGSPTGGITNATNWTRFHRHRLVSMMNSSQVAMAETLPSFSLPHAFSLPDREIYPLGALETPGGLSGWVESFSDGAFTEASCLDFLDDVPGMDHCWFNSQYYSSVSKVNMSEFYSFKYLPDVDGHGYSGRFRSYVESDSVPIKATIWNEWTSSRLQAWTHFVPMDNTYMDWWGVMEYFLGYTPPDRNRTNFRHSHEKNAKAIADQGREWGRKTLRREDMVLYLWRVLLEYGRVTNDNREFLGYVDDLLAET